MLRRADLDGSALEPLGRSESNHAHRPWTASQAADTSIIPYTRGDIPKKTRFIGSDKLVSVQMLVPACANFPLLELPGPGAEVAVCKRSLLSRSSLSALDLGLVAATILQSSNISVLPLHTALSRPHVAGARVRPETTQQAG